MTDHLKDLFEKDLLRVKTEIEAYSDDEGPWILSGDISNTGGNLVMHISGNLRYFVGAVLGGTGYIRDRENEFAVKNMSREELVEEIELCAAEVFSAMDQLDDGNMDEEYPHEMFGAVQNTGWFLLKLSGHLNYHLGQINYHRRLIG